MSAEKLRNYLIRLKEDYDFLERRSRRDPDDALELADEVEKIYYLILDTEDALEASQGKRPWPVVNEKE